MPEWIGTFLQFLNVLLPALGVGAQTNADLGRYSLRLPITTLLRRKTPRPDHLPVLSDHVDLPLSRRDRLVAPEPTGGVPQPERHFEDFVVAVVPDVLDVYRRSIDRNLGPAENLCG